MSETPEKKYKYKRYARYPHLYDQNRQIQQNQWTKENKERINILVPKGERNVIKQYAKEQGFKSVNEYITTLIYDDMNN